MDKRFNNIFDDLLETVKNNANNKGYLDSIVMYTIPENFQHAAEMISDKLENYEDKLSTDAIEDYFEETFNFAAINNIEGVICIVPAEDEETIEKIICFTLYTPKNEVFSNAATMIDDNGILIVGEFEDIWEKSAYFNYEYPDWR